MRTLVALTMLLAAATAHAQLRSGPTDGAAPSSESWEWQPEYANGLQQLLRSTKNGILVQLIPRYFESGYAVGLEDGARVASAMDASAAAAALTNTANAIHAEAELSGPVALDEAQALMPAGAEAQFFGDKYQAAFGWAAKDAGELGSDVLKQAVLAAFTRGYLAGARHVIAAPWLGAQMASHASTLCAHLVQYTRHRAALGPEKLRTLAQGCDRRAEDAVRWALELHPLAPPAR